MFVRGWGGGIACEPQALLPSPGFIYIYILFFLNEFPLKELKPAVSARRFPLLCSAARKRRECPPPPPRPALQCWDAGFNLTLLKTEDSSEIRRGRSVFFLGCGPGVGGVGGGGQGALARG